MELIAATGNAGKLREFQRIFAPLGITVKSQMEACPAVEIIENGTTFAQNAFIKAKTIFERTGLPTIADDSGLCVDALNGAPGVYSARYAGGQHDDQANNKKLLEALKDVPPERRAAYFACAICCILGENDMIEVEGRCLGSIALEKRGSGGFGYDPLFLVGEKSFGELSAAEKDAISHRGQALAALYARLKERSGNN